METIKIALVFIFMIGLFALLAVAFKMLGIALMVIFIAYSIYKFSAKVVELYMTEKDDN